MFVQLPIAIIIHGPYGTIRWWITRLGQRIQPHDLRGVDNNRSSPTTDHNIRSSPTIQLRASRRDPIRLLDTPFNCQLFIAFYGCLLLFLVKFSREEYEHTPLSLTATWGEMRNPYRLSGGPEKVHHRPPSARPTWSFLTVRNLERVFPEKVSIT
jgi:hypothetical protein